MNFKRIKKKKKGQIQQIVFVIVFITIFAISVLLGRGILDRFDNQLEDGGHHTNESREALNTFQSTWASFDTLVVFVVIGLTLGLLVTSWVLPSHPVFVVVNIIGIFVLVLVSAVLANTYGEIKESGIFAEGGDYDNIDFIMTKLPWICVVITVLSSIVLYTKRGSVNSGGGPI